MLPKSSGPERPWPLPNGRLLVCVVLLPLLSSKGHSQAAAPTNVAFEVVSIKRNTSVAASRGRIEPGRFTAVGVPIVQVIRQAYDILDVQLGPTPDWVRSDGYDILAKSPDGVDIARDLPPLLQSMLKARFQLEIHYERREMPIYELTVARSDRRLGPRLRESAADCSVNPPVLPPAAQREADDAPPCALFGTIGRRTMRGFPLPRFARMLAGETGRVVHDKTGLGGTWNVDLEYMPDQVPPLPPGGLPFGASLPSPDAPNLFTAVQEQLGLKLVSARGSVEVLIIDRIERPTED
jgi:uncharacterized protein (TIGR03435 family)